MLCNNFYHLSQTYYIPGTIICNLHVIFSTQNNASEKKYIILLFNSLQYRCREGVLGTVRLVHSNNYLGLELHPTCDMFSFLGFVKFKCSYLPCHHHLSMDNLSTWNFSKLQLDAWCSGNVSVHDLTQAQDVEVFPLIYLYLYLKCLASLHFTLSSSAIYCLHYSEE